MTDTETNDAKMRRLLTTLMIRILEDGRKVATKDGEIVMVDAGPSDFREARAWLKELEKGSGVGTDQGSGHSKLLRNAVLRFSGQEPDMGLTGTES